MIMNARMEGGRRKGKPRRQWMDGVQEDIASLGIRNWKTMATDRVQWRTVLLKGRLSTANSGTKVVVVLVIIGVAASHCFSHPTLSLASE